MLIPVSTEARSMLGYHTPFTITGLRLLFAFRSPTESSAPRLIALEMHVCDTSSARDASPLLAYVTPRIVTGLLTLR